MTKLHFKRLPGLAFALLGEATMPHIFFDFSGNRRDEVEHTIRCEPNPPISPSVCVWLCVAPTLGHMGECMCVWVHLCAWVCACIGACYYVNMCAEGRPRL